MTFIDDYSRYTRVYLLSSKDEAENMFIKFKTEVEIQKNKKIRRLRFEKNMVQLCLKNFVKKMVLFIESLYPVHLNKME